ncbi:hypothetical protein PRIPAC_75245 [Pristionchus pacificus]|uniref:Uncharacterized protein n=1 Tax=Pristionchus pacificus TaxID=54126 RepID=A0A2A6CFM2_PRIPA|nr:hypothetical protein PRIPAC_75245 [Pristionchus pacificus]|eukprot:PDM76929.1 hypothetical protein PRIPAC_42324 [Pristionchus pacificus]
MVSSSHHGERQEAPISDIDVSEAIAHRCAEYPGKEDTSIPDASPPVASKLAMEKRDERWRPHALELWKRNGRANEDPALEVLTDSSDASSALVSSAMKELSGDGTVACPRHRLVFHLLVLLEFLARYALAAKCGYGNLPSRQAAAATACDAACRAPQRELQ